MHAGICQQKASLFYSWSSMGEGYKLQKRRVPGMHFILMEDYMTGVLVYYLAPHASIHHLAAPSPSLFGGAGPSAAPWAQLYAGSVLDGREKTHPLKKRWKIMRKEKYIMENHGPRERGKVLTSGWYTEADMELFIQITRRIGKMSLWTPFHHWAYSPWK